MPYVPSEIEPKWQARWKSSRAFATDQDTSKPKFYVLDMFPYPSGAGLHVGHCEGYTATDILARFKRANGFRVLHPMGWDAFGLPAENYAIRTGTHPSIVTQESIANFKRQIDSLGFSYDWEHEVDTTDANYYRWTQWIFLQLFHKGLAYQSDLPINWCPKCKTGLANEEVKQGRCERCESLVERKQLRQWVLKITEYADRLLADLEGLDWPVSTLTMQREWIGRSEGAEVTFVLADGASKGEPIVVFTTRPDTLFGATYMVLAPEHPLVATCTSEAQREAVNTYVESAKNKSDRERQEGAARTKTGVFTGAFAINPANGQPVPVWIADYVLWGYGTGAIMAVPAHDQRDFDFATAFALPIVQVIAPKDGAAVPSDRAFEVSGDEAVLVNSGQYTGQSSAEAMRKIVADLASQSLAKATVNYKLRDWVFSRQRYWGEPIPVVHCAACGTVAVPEDQLPVRLPDVVSYEPSGTGESPLATIDAWVHTTCPQCGGPGRRETNTMPQWAGSCWYYLRFLDAKNSENAWDSAREKAWMNVDLYIGGAEHAVLHLLYARFWHKVLYDLGVVSTTEPFARLRHQGLVLSYAYRDANDRWYGYDDIEQVDGKNWVGKSTGLPLSAAVEKMAKTKLNVINPDDVVREHGADALRCYEMFMGDFEQSKPWDTRAIKGVTRFLANVHSVVFEPKDLAEDLHVRARHKTIRAVGERIEGFKFNTAISAMMEYVSALQSKGSTRADREALVQLVGPFAPHLGEACWEELGHSELLCHAPWPTFDQALTIDDVLVIPVQVSGKLRGTVEVPRDASERDVYEAAQKVETVLNALAGKTVIKVIFVQNKMLNLVAK
ncbi:MAG: leucine--tRNA ligase [Deltaproteobacteria bacterium]|nr:leucine--tRNA ligase [Deltaproteobacteria bacterium]